MTRTAAAGDNLGVRLSQTSAVTGNAFFADGFSLTAGGSDPPPPPPPPVNQPPVAAFTTSPASPVAGQPVTFTDASTDDGQVAGRAWDLDNDGQFDDGTGTTATATFAAAGSYTVSLRVTDNGSPALSAATSRTVGAVRPPRLRRRPRRGTWWPTRRSRRICRAGRGFQATGGA